MESCYCAFNRRIPYNQLADVLNLFKTCTSWVKEYEKLEGGGFFSDFIEILRFQ